MRGRNLVRTAVFALLLGLQPVLLPPATCAADYAALKEAEAHVAAGDRYAGQNQNFLATREYRQAIALGLDQSGVYWKLSLALYGLGLIDEALVAIDKAQQLTPDANYLHLPTGILYLAKGELKPAERQFIAALRINPGFADAYYYLGEVYLRQGEYPRAWLCCRMAQTLGHPADGLQAKLAAVAAPPEVTPWREAPDTLHLRLIQAKSREEAQQLLDRIAAGEPFEYVAIEKVPETSQGFGGYAGIVDPAEMDPAIAAAMLERKPFDPPVLLEVAGGFQILQRLAPFEPDYWEQQLKPAKQPKPAVAGETKPTTSVVAGDSYFRLHAGSCSTEAAASKLLAQLERHGFPAYMFRQDRPDGINFHVVAGRFTDHDQAESAAARLDALKINHYIVKVKGRIPELSVSSPPSVAPAENAPPAQTPVPVAVATVPEPSPEPQPLPAAAPVAELATAPAAAPAAPIAILPVDAPLQGVPLPTVPSPVSAAVPPSEPIVAVSAPAPESKSQPQPELLPAGPGALAQDAPPAATVVETQPAPPAGSMVAPVPVAVAAVPAPPPEPATVSQPETPMPAPAAVANVPVTESQHAAQNSLEPLPASRPPVPSGPAPLRFRLLAGSYDSAGAADERLGVLEQQGFQAFVVTRPDPGGKPVQVVAGKYASRGEALAAATRLEVIGIAYLVSEDGAASEGQSPAGGPVAGDDRREDKLPAVTMTPPAKKALIRVSAGSFSSEANAQKRLAQLEQHGFAGYISWQNVPDGKIFHVFAGKFASRQTADAAAAQLKKLGIESYLTGGE